MPPAGGPDGRSAFTRTCGVASLASRPLLPPLASLRPEGRGGQDGRRTLRRLRRYSGTCVSVCVLVCGPRGSVQVILASKRNSECIPKYRSGATCPPEGKTAAG